MSKVTMSKSLTRKSKAKKPAPGSLASYVEDYQVAGFMKKQAACLAQLAYGQETIRKRLANLEAVALAGLLGAVEIDDALHMLSCAKR